MTDQEMRDKISQLYAIIFGVEGQGGLAREVEDMSKRIAALEKQHIKLAIMMFMAAALGGSASSSLAKLLNTLHLLP